MRITAALAAQRRVVLMAQPKIAVAALSAFAMAAAVSGAAQSSAGGTMGQPSAAHVQRVVATPTHTWTAPGVSAIVQSGTTLYIGGGFDQIGHFTGLMASVSGRSGAISGRFPRVSGHARGQWDTGISAMVADGQGGWVIGGSFEFVDGKPCPALAHVLANGTWDRAWCPTPDRAVYALARRGSTIYLGGEFERVGAKQRLRLAAVDLASGRVVPWDPRVTGKPFSDSHDSVSVHVADMAVSGRAVYLEGYFQGVGGAKRSNLAAVDAVTGRVRGWNPGAGPFSSVREIEAAGGVVYFGGSFDSFDGKARSGLAAVEGRTGRLLRWSPALSSSVGALTVLGRIVYASGFFGPRGGEPRSREDIVAVDGVTARVLPWNPDKRVSIKNVFALTANRSAVYVAGEFDSSGWANRFAIGFDRRTGRRTSWQPRPDGSVHVLVANGMGIVLGGQFYSVRGERRLGLAALNMTTGAVNNWSPVVAGGGVQTLAIDGSTLYAGGNFKRVSGQLRRGLAAFDLRSQRIRSWYPGGLPPGFDGYIYGVRAIAPAGGVIYVGGDFTQIGGQERFGVAAVDAESGQLLPMATRIGSPPDDGVTAIAVASDRVFIAGDFKTVNGVRRDGLAALDPSSLEVAGWNPTNDGYGDEAALSTSGQRVYAARNFTRVNGQSRTGLAAFDATTGLLLPWNPQASTGIFGIQAIAAGGSTVYVGGSFDRIGGESRPCLAAVRATDAIATDWAPPTAEGSSACLFNGIDLLGNTLAVSRSEGPSALGGASRVDIFRVAP